MIRRRVLLMLAAVPAACASAPALWAHADAADTLKKAVDALSGVPK